MGLSLRCARHEDAALLLAWRNDPLTRRFSFSGEEVSPRAHLAWLQHRLADPCTSLWIAEQDGEPVGQVRADTIGLDEGAAAELHITVAPAARGRGLAVEMLEQAGRLAASGMQVTALRARVMADNRASLAAFARAGFCERRREGGAVLLERRIVADA